jgi:hypothetical protein
MPALTETVSDHPDRTRTAAKAYWPATDSSVACARHWFRG